MSEKKKQYFELPQVERLLEGIPQDVRNEYDTIVSMLEKNGTLVMPYGEKIQGKNLFAIRIIQTANIRVFYVYGMENHVYGLHAYYKKTQKIQKHEMDLAEKSVKILRKAGKVK